MQTEVGVSQNDIRWELLQSVVTNQYVSGELYFCIFKLISTQKNEDQKKLESIMSSRALLENHLHMGKLNIEPQFQFDVNYRNKFKRISSEVAYSVAEPYSETIKSLLGI